MIRVRLLAAAVLLGLAATLIVLGPPQREAAAAGEESSAVTVNGRPGKYEDFSDLAITVHQTEGLVGQGIEVTWTGGVPTPYGGFGTNYLSIMQCWGPDPEAPDFRETCQFGAGLDPPYSNLRTGNASRYVTEDFDPAETMEPIPVGDELTSNAVPFRASYGGTYVDALTGAGGTPRPAPDGYEGLIIDLYGKGSTNEQPWVPTAGSGEGRTVFWVQSAKEAAHLGCGRVGDDGGDPQPCWLVVVPRGAYDPFGNVRGAQVGGVDSPLSASNFANAIAIELNFAPVSGFCELGAQERATIGTELAAEAMTSWQPALCAGGGTTFGYAATSDSEAANQLFSTYEGAPGLAYTTIPIAGGADDPPVAHAPVAVSAMTIAFSIDIHPRFAAPPEVEALFGSQVPELKLTPRLVAKLLTQSYWGDIPILQGETGVEHLPENPQFITYDPEFRALNPVFENFPDAASGPKGLMVTLESGQPVHEIWRWILADPQARAWLAGTPDENGIVVNPKYAPLNLDEEPPHSFPRAEDTCVRQPPAEMDLCSLDYRPYIGSYSEIAQRVLRADVGEKSFWDQTREPPQYVTSPPRAFGRRWSIGVTETASAHRYGVFTASLRNAAGEFVAPTQDGLRAAVDAMTDTDGDGVLELDPARRAVGAYPLTMVTYAAVNTGQDPQALTDYADLLEYAAGPGQQSGTARGELPGGYLPLPAELRDQTTGVVAELRALAGATPTPTPTPTTPAPGPSPSAAAAGSRRSR
ncbi:hypothetical protein [Jiangella anatolica]|uniref:PBP domain-containing protein n=1 Tax=Jiangella anatolica TaxID=2670374 RepID=A0A2W2BFS8_9ACTN|nr:hypothetical protein [Jiangella anatolica]PZF79114.1 hypothetical protein C1I92_32815 [Jiangella anatolica]